MILDDKTKKSLAELAKTPHVNTLRAFVEAAKNEIDSIDGVESIDEVLGRRHALKVLDDLFGFLKEEKSKTGRTTYT